METFDTTGKLETLAQQSAPRILLLRARRIVLHWVVRLLITWFGFGLLTAATVTGLQALSVDISPMERRLIAFFNRTFGAVPG